MIPELLSKVMQGFATRSAHSMVVEAVRLLCQTLKHEGLSDSPTAPDETQTGCMLAARGEVSQLLPFGLAADHIVHSVDCHNLLKYGSVNHV
jgi:hypothetical protein